MKEIIIQNPNNLPTINFRNLMQLQGDLKNITKTNLEKLKQSIIKYGYFVPAFVWINEGKYYVIDAHQRIKALLSLADEGLKIPKIHYIEIEAENKKEAAEKLLFINSRFGEINPDTDFFDDFDLDLDILKEIEIPELDFDVLNPEIGNDKKENTKLKMGLSLGESYDYIVFRFDNEFDFRFICDYFELENEDFSKTKNEKLVGIGRILHSDKLLKLIQ